MKKSHNKILKIQTFFIAIQSIATVAYTLLILQGFDSLKQEYAELKSQNTSYEKIIKNNKTKLNHLYHISINELLREYKIKLYSLAYMEKITDVSIIDSLPLKPYKVLDLKAKIDYIKEAPKLQKTQQQKKKSIKNLEKLRSKCWTSDCTEKYNQEIKKYYQNIHQVQDSSFRSRLSRLQIFSSIKNRNLSIDDILISDIAEANQFLDHQLEKVGITFSRIIESSLKKEFDLITQDRQKLLKKNIRSFIRNNADALSLPLIKRIPVSKDIEEIQKYITENEEELVKNFEKSSQLLINIESYLRNIEFN